MNDLVQLVWTNRLHANLDLLDGRLQGNNGSL
jgi:hypothetical protein